MDDKKKRLEEKVKKVREDARLKLMNDCLIGESLGDSDLILGMLIGHLKEEVDTWNR